MPYLQHLAPDHDEVLLVRYADDDLAGRELDQARRLIASCPACAQVVDDIRAIRVATVALPMPRRARDFRLTDADAARLRPGGWRGWLARFSGRDRRSTQPLATGLVALGIAGLLFAIVPGGLTGLGSASSAESRTTAAAGAPANDQAVPAASAVPGDVQVSMAPVGPTVAGPESGGGSVPAPSAGPIAVSSPGAPAKGSLPDASAGPSVAPGFAAAPSGARDARTDAGNLASGGTGVGGGTTEPAAAGSGNSVPSPLVLVSLVLLASGLGLGLLRWAGRRVA